MGYTFKREDAESFAMHLLGHKSVTVTQIYLRMSMEQQKAAIDKAVNW